MRILIRKNIPEGLSGRPLRQKTKQAIKGERWIEIPIDYDEFQAMTTVTAQFLELRQYIPDGHHPVKIERSDHAAVS